MNLVFDSNIYIAAFATHGLCQALFEICLDTHSLFISEEILTEITKGLDKKIKIPLSVISNIVLYLKQNTRVIKPQKIENPQCRDPNDDHVLELCIAAKTQYLVTGDKDLLAMKSYQGIAILTPREFWEELRKGANP